MRNLRRCGLATAVPARPCSRSGRRVVTVQPGATCGRGGDGFHDARRRRPVRRAKGHAAWRGWSTMRRVYRRLPEEVRRCLRPLNLLDEVSSFLPGRLRPGAHATVEAMRRLGRLARTRYPVRRLEGPAQGSGGTLTCLVATDDLSARYWAATIFAAVPRETVLGQVPALGVAAAARRLAPAADLSLWQTPWPIYDLVRGTRIPSWLPLSLSTDRSLEEVIAGDRSG